MFLLCVLLRYFVCVCPCDLFALCLEPAGDRMQVMWREVDGGRRICSSGSAALC